MDDEIIPHAGGRPPIFDSPDKFVQACDEYFNTTLPGTRTITGLALYLGFESRQSFYDYEKRDEFSYIVKTARLKVENDYELTLRSASVAGSIFALKNMGWKDRNEVAPVDPDGNALKQELTIKIIRDTASSITPGDFTPKPAASSEPGEAV